jgi:hypothetical protein
MDASDRAKHNGNGKHVPDTGSLPSAAVVPQGAPVGALPALPAAEAQAGTPPTRKPNGQFVGGKSGNPAGKPKGIPNRNTQLLRELGKFEIEGKSYERLLLEVSLLRAKAGDSTLAVELMRRTYVTITPEAAGLVLNVNQSNQQVQQETNVQVGERLGHEGTRRAVALLTEQLALGGAFSGEPRNVRQ